MRRLFLATLTFLILAGIATPQAADEARLLRFPAIHGDRSSSPTPAICTPSPPTAASPGG